MECLSRARPSTGQRRARPFSVAALALFVGACSSSPPGENPGPSMEFDEWPDRLSDTGLFPADTALTPGGFATLPNTVEYSPHHSLWINGSEKVRHLVLPAGATIDTADAEAWSIPEGSLAFKTIFFARNTDGSGRVPVETRVLKRTAEGLDYAVYLWNDAGTEAELSSGTEPVLVDVTNTNGNTLTHAVPSRLDCRKCHESSPRVLLGLTERQLAGSTEAFVEQGWLDDPVDREEPDEHSALELDVLGYFYGNCTHCHNGWIGANSTYSLLPDEAFDNVVGQMTQGNASAPGIRVEPGEPEGSILFLSLRVNDPDYVSPVDGVRAMPPVGVQHVDTAGIELVQGWIEGLAGASSDADGDD